MRRMFIIIGLVVLVNKTSAQDPETYSGPIIDMHLHAYSAERFWGPAPNPSTQKISVKNSTEHVQKSITLLKDNNIVLAVVDGDSPSAVDPWEQEFDHEIIRGLYLNNPRELDIDQFKEWVKDGRVELFGEIGPYTEGIQLLIHSFSPFMKSAKSTIFPWESMRVEVFRE